MRRKYEMLSQVPRPRLLTGVISAHAGTYGTNVPYEHEKTFCSRFAISTSQLKTLPGIYKRDNIFPYEQNKIF